MSISGTSPVYHVPPFRHLDRRTYSALENTHRETRSEREDEEDEIDEKEEIHEGEVRSVMVKRRAGESNVGALHGAK